DNARLRRQATLCYRAPISTIHSFCAELLRENAHKLGLAPDFRVADETECTLLKVRVLDDLFDSRCDDVSDGAESGFALLADMFFTGRGDRRLRDIVLDVYSRLQSHPYPDRWVAAQLDRLNFGNVSDAAETVWGAAVMDDARRAARHWLGVMRGLFGEMEDHPDFMKAYGRSVAVTIAGIEGFLAAMDKGWDAARARARVEFPPARVSGYDELKDVRKRCSKGMKKVAETFAYSSAELLEDMAATAPVISELLRLTLDFAAAYSVSKRERGLIDFSDQEHLACELLIDGQTGMPTDTARAVRDRYREILVDEYQDVNAVQELIFRAISRDGDNIFMVGDVRQSIYGFRLADPTIFLEKYRTYSDGAPRSGRGARVLLTGNFRSRAGILDAVNYVFKNIMSEGFGGMDYTEREYLRAGRGDDADSPEPPVELDVLDMGAQEQEDAARDTLSAAEAEAEHVARRIEELMCAAPFLPDGNGGVRAAECADFAILLRSVKGKAAFYHRALARRGIPAELPGRTSFFKTPEITAAMSLLSVIDNPMQDIPLISVLRGPVYGFTADELAAIRAILPNADFYTALKAAAETDARCGAFISELASLRAAAPDMPADRFICHVYSVTSLPGRMAAMGSGGRRRENLMLLVEYARKFEADGHKGLFGFVSFMRRLAENGTEPEAGRTEGAAGGAVRVMSIHKSKGLEFPIVFLADTSKKLYKEDMRSPVLIHSALGVGVKRRDTRRRIEYQTLARAAIGGAMTAEMMAEELRVLYVAMTRAREKLVIVSTLRRADKTLRDLYGRASAPVPAQTLRDAAAVSEWLLLAALTRPEAVRLVEADESEPVAWTETLGPEDWDMRLYGAERFGDPLYGAQPDDAQEAAQDGARAAARDEDVAELRRRFEFVYPYRASENLPSKLTVTELKGKTSDEALVKDAHMYIGRRGARPPAIPDGTGALTGAERGTAIHLVMQHIDYAKCNGPDGIRAELARLTDARIITAEQAEAADIPGIAAFFTSETGSALRSADKIFREFKFSLLTPASSFFPGGGEDEILFQGVIDCAYESDGRLTVVDFKTDRVTGDTLAERARVYAPQLRHYADALTRVTGLPVARRSIYFFAVRQFYEIGDDLESI
ncbi:MAG: helicase-exonuclease AddAB subunit AddA, partial [Oscillospiraceae bacterium]|nr:helicase-exonuclease AddAB subunit AddA [Oscillospiraceae bacterium]